MIPRDRFLDCIFETFTKNTLLLSKVLTECDGHMFYSTDPSKRNKRENFIHALTSTDFPCSLQIICSTNVEKSDNVNLALYIVEEHFQIFQGLSAMLDLIGPIDLQPEEAEDERNPEE